MNANNESNQLQITTKEYQTFCDFLEKSTGIVLGEDKLYLVNSRLGNIMVKHNVTSITQLLDKLTTIAEYSLREKVIDAMTTNETNWFRDIYPYTVLTDKILPCYKNQNQLRIWSAACSTGQEPFSISICVSEYAERISWTPFANMVKILATDIATIVLERAKNREYSSLEMDRGISDERRQRFFERKSSACYKLKDLEYSRVSFQQFNLLANYAMLGKFDIIFCRNALIYFSALNRENIINKFADCLNPGGYLVLGSSESIPQQCKQFKIINCQPGIIYQKL